MTQEQIPLETTELRAHLFEIARNPLKFPNFPKLLRDDRKIFDYLAPHFDVQPMDSDAAFIQWQEAAKLNYFLNRHPASFEEREEKQSALANIPEDWDTLVTEIYSKLEGSDFKKFIRRDLGPSISKQNMGTIEGTYVFYRALVEVGNV